MGFELREFRNPPIRSNTFLGKGWCQFRYDPALAEWVRQSISTARNVVRRTENAHWLRCGGTWFAGVNALPNNAQGSVADGPPLAGRAVDFIREMPCLRDLSWDRAQISVCYPGYPQPMSSDSDAAFRYRRDRDAAHVDGLLAEGPDRRRHLREHHGFLLGIPMVECGVDASPFVIWEGSHEVVRAAFAEAFKGVPPEQWGEVDITDAYHEVRRRVFDTCRRVEVWARPGEAYLAHRFSVHGTAPWRESAVASSDGRMICYFRPEIRGPREWLTAP
jgi:hypothetical protein